MTFPSSHLCPLPSPSLTFHGGNPAVWWQLVGTELRTEKAGKGVEKLGWRLRVTELQLAVRRKIQCIHYIALCHPHVSSTPILTVFFLTTTTVPIPLLLAPQPTFGSDDRSQQNIKSLTHTYAHAHTQSGTRGVYC